MRFINLILCSVCVLILQACEDDMKVKTTEREISIIGTGFPETIKLGDNANLKLYVQYVNPCASFSRLERSTNNDTLILKAYGDYKDGNCPQVLKTDSTYINFEARINKIYYFKMYRVLEEPLIDSIRVQ